MKKTTILAAIALSVLCATSVPAQVNGSFEDGLTPGSFMTLTAGQTNITGWSIDFGSIDYVGTHWFASDGYRSIDLNGVEAGQISQTFATTPGVTYEVSFDMSGNPGGGPEGKVMSVYAGATAPQTFEYLIGNNAPQFMAWATHTYTFTAVGTETTLVFASLTEGFDGPALDRVTVTAVSQPPTPTPSPTPTSTPTPTPTPTPAPEGQICHRNNGNGGRTLTVSPSAIPAHLRHGDYMGPCTSGS